MADWMLIETFGGHRPEPTVMAISNIPRSLVPLSKVLGRARGREPLLNDVLALVARVVDTGQTLHTPTTDGRRRMIGEPIKTLGGRVHGVHVWTGRPDEEPPPRDAVGAWHVNLTRYTSSRSDDLLGDVYGIAPEKRKHEVSIAQLFGYNRLQTHNDESSAMAKLIQSKPGDEHQATWTVNRDDGVKRAANFAFRTMAEPNVDGATEVIGRGITHDIGPAEQIPASPTTQPMLLAQQVVAAEKTPGRWRAIVNLRTLTLMKWVDDPVPGIVWELEAPYPRAIHRRDLRTAKKMADALASRDRVTAELRFRAMDGGWMRLSVTANLMLLDQHTTAALVTLEQPADDPKIN